MKRLFIAILLPQEIKKELVNLQKEYQNLKVRWTRPENIHFTLVFIGWVEKEKTKAIEEIVRKVAEKSFPFYIKLQKIVLGPSRERPRMIWAIGPLNEKIIELRKKIVKDFEKNRINFEDRHEFKVHVTLARAQGKELWGRKIEENLDLSFAVNKIYLMESELKPEGVKYKTLALLKLKQ